MKKRKLLLPAVAALALACTATMGSLSQMTAAAQAKNTVTLGALGLSLTEPAWSGEARLIPGTTIGKDPTLTVLHESARCYVFATLTMPEKELFDKAGIQLQYEMADGTWANGIAPEWCLMDQALPDDMPNTTLYVYQSVLPATTAEARELPPLFGRVMIPGGASPADCCAAAANSITVKGWAIQADGFETAANAWAALCKQTQGTTGV